MKEVAYFVEMEPNMVKGVALFQVVFEEGSTSYVYFDQAGDANPMDVSTWERLPQDRLVPVNEGIVDEWKQTNPLGYELIAQYVL